MLCSLSYFTQLEVFRLRTCSHPHLVPLLASFVEDSSIVLVFPDYSLGSVRDLLDRHYTEGLPEHAIAIIVRDVLLGLQYLHDKVGYSTSTKCRNYHFSSSQEHCAPRRKS